MDKIAQGEGTLGSVNERGQRILEGTQREVILLNGQSFSSLTLILNATIFITLPRRFAARHS